MPGNIVVTGRPGSGKTTLVMRIAERLAARGFKAGGFITEEIRKGRGRVGFLVRDLAGNAKVLAHVSYRGKQRVGKYGVDVAAFESIALHALMSGKEEADLLIIDEIGRMELFSPSFRSALPGLLDAPVPVLATAHSGSDAFTDALLARDDVIVHVLDQKNRESILEVIDGSMHRILTERRTP